MSVPCCQVDAFSNGPFTGNPAAVCLLSQEASPQWMQAVAAEMNLAETAFVSPLRESATAWKLRWFTPKVEVDLCGHATLASACVLYATGAVADDRRLSFSTASGILHAAPAGGGQLELDFPECAPTPGKVPSGLSAALGVEVDQALANGTDLLVEVADEAQLRALEPDFTALAKIDAIRGVIVTSPSESDKYDFASRFFAPAVGINEDPVTGSAHCCLAPYWARKLKLTRMVGYQASARGGMVEVELQEVKLQEAESNARRVKLRGKAELILRGELLVDPY